mgnify:CR=1 FL=1
MNATPLHTTTRVLETASLAQEFMLTAHPAFTTLQMPMRGTVLLALQEVLLGIKGLVLAGVVEVFLSVQLSMLAALSAIFAIRISGGIQGLLLAKLAQL